MARSNHGRELWLKVMEIGGFMNPMRKPNNEERLKRQTDFVLEWLKQLAAGFRVELSEATQAVYLNQFFHFPIEMLEPAFRRTLQEWEKPNQFPPPAFIRARLINHRLAGEQAWDLVMLIR